MARTTVPVNVLSSGGIGVGSGTGETTGDPVNFHDVDNDGDVILVARNNDGGASHFVAWECPVLMDGTPVANVAVSIGASSTIIFGPFPTRLYNQANGRVHFTVDSAQLLLKAYRMPEVS
jgi:hypothetical protein